jgi:predicted helicase
MYDSYIRAIRWATDRIGEQGVIAYVTNGGWIDGNTADGIRLSLAEDFSTLYVYNLRGNQRTSGDQSRKEGGKVFGGGSRNTVAMLIAVKNPAHTRPCCIHYHDIGDYLTRDQKLAIVDEGELATTEWVSIAPNTSGDWVNQRNKTFATYLAIGNKAAPALRDVTVFADYSLGLATGRDAWTYNYSAGKLRANVTRMIGSYNDEVERHKYAPDLSDQALNSDPSKISWNRNLRQDLRRGKRYTFYEDSVRVGVYRPFMRQQMYFHQQMNAMLYQLPSMFPTPDHENIGIVLTGPASHFDFTPFIVDALPNLHVLDTAQFFPRWTYKHVEPTEGEIAVGVNSDTDEHGYRRIDNITDAILAEYQASFGEQVSKDDIFYYTYGLLHSPQYRETFAADLKKMLPRIPKASSRADFEAFAAAGHELADLHVGYESVKPYPLTETITGTPADERELWRVTKMRWRSKSDHSAIVYNSHVTLEGIPEEAHRYLLGPRTALDWLIDRYRVTTDKASGIVNDPNDWCDEHDEPRYIVELVKRVTTVSVETMRIVDALPALELQ